MNKVAFGGIGFSLLLFLVGNYDLVLFAKVLIWWTIIYELFLQVFFEEWFNPITSDTGQAYIYWLTLFAWLITLGGIFNG